MNRRTLHFAPGACLSKWPLPLALAVVALITVAVYWPVLQNGFIDFDDPDYVTVNMMVRNGLSLKGLTWSLTAFHAGNWHPLTWLSHMLDVELFGMNPLGHHAVNLLLHTANSTLLCLLLCRLTGCTGRSIVVALLFALHPLHVESVAWIAERKDLLSTLFWLLTLGTYAGYARAPSLWRYLSVTGLFALGLMAKQMVVTLPLILFLMDWWPLKRVNTTETAGDLPAVGLQRLLVEKIPLLIISAGASLVTLSAQATAGALSRLDSHSALISSGNALIASVSYLKKMIWPSGLALFYPLEPARVTALRVAGSAILLVALTVFTALQQQKRPWLLFGWLWYLITLVPVIGIIRVGSQAMADRYTYIPLVGLFIAIVWEGIEFAGKRRRGLPAAAGVAVAALISLSVLTVNQIRIWETSSGLYEHALTVVDNNWLAHNNIGILLAQRYRTGEAIEHFRESLRINPNQGTVFRNLGNAYQSVGSYTAAVEAFQQAIRLNPDDAEAHFRLGYAYLMGGNPDLAYREYLDLRRLDESQGRALIDSIRRRQTH